MSCNIQPAPSLQFPTYSEDAVANQPPMRPSAHKGHCLNVVHQPIA